jgi:SnoaL-like domain
MAGSEATSAQELLEIEAIRQLKARYCLVVDAQDWARYRDLFTDDARIGGELPLTGEPSGRAYDPDAFVAAVSQTLRGWLTLHTVHGSLIELTSDTTARGLWAYTQRGFGHTGGYYNEEYAKGEHGWRIAAMQITLVHPYRREDPHTPRDGLDNAHRQALIDQWIPTPRA